MSPRKHRPPIVVKFGGGALRSARPAVERIRSYLRTGERVVVVASARAGVTDALEELAYPRTSPARRRALLQWIARLHASPDGVADAALQELRGLIRAPPRTAADRIPWADRIRAMGERLAARWLADQLESAGVPAVPLESDRLGLLTDGEHGGATIDLDASRSPMRSGILRALRVGAVPVVTGYLGRSPTGAVTTLGRGGSDYSATVIGQLLGARRVDLIKPEGAIRTADPQKVPSSRRVAKLSYDTAEELAQFGARVLHPLAIDPARTGGLTVNVVGAAPSGPLTRIGGGAGTRSVRIITSTGPLRRMVIPVSGGRYRPGALAEAAGRLASEGIPILGVFTSARHLTLILPIERTTRHRRAGGRRAVRVDHADVCVVSVVGEGVVAELSRIRPEILAGSLEIAATARSIALVVPRSRADAVVRSLHRSLVERPERRTPPRRRRAP
jgi:aspartate kinase